MEIVKQTWADVRQGVSLLNPRFAEIIDSISPDESYRLYKVSYPYGASILEKGRLFLPAASEKNLLPLSSSYFSQQEDLSYNDLSNPVSLILTNSTEIYLDLADRIIALYGLIGPGKIISTWKVLSGTNWSYAAAFSWNMSAGARSIFLAQKISDKAAHANIQKAFNIKDLPPKALIDHWHIFKNTVNHPSFGEPWKTTVLFFSKQWFDHLNDSAWRDFYFYLYQTAWVGSEFWRNQFLWDLSFSLLLKERHIRACPYIVKTVKQLLAIASGATPGFAPQDNEISAPISRIKFIYQNIYKLFGSPPTPLSSTPFINTEKESPVYYSLNFPNETDFIPKAKQQTSLIADLREVKTVLEAYTEEVRNHKFNIVQTPIYRAARNVDFTFYHSEQDPHYQILQNANIVKDDKRFMFDESAIFPVNSSFFRSCIKIMQKNH